MPTGYTAAVEDGEITDLKSFALLCSRAFMPLVKMRDEPLSTPVPRKIEPGTYYRDRLAAAEQELKNALALSDAECASCAAEAFLQATESLVQRRQERELHRQRYAAMADKVRAWSGAPDGLKTFMLDQLTQSNASIGDGLFDREPILRTGGEWRLERVAQCRRDLEYARRLHNEDVDRAAKATEWLAQLWASLEPES